MKSSHIPSLLLSPSDGGVKRFAAGSSGAGCDTGTGAGFLGGCGGPSGGISCPEGACGGGCSC